MVWLADLFNREAWRFRDAIVQAPWLLVKFGVFRSRPSFSSASCPFNDWCERSLKKFVLICASKAPLLAAFKKPLKHISLLCSRTLYCVLFTQAASPSGPRISNWLGESEESGTISDCIVVFYLAVLWNAHDTYITLPRSSDITYDSNKEP